MRRTERIERRGGSNFIEVRFREDINDKINLSSYLKEVREQRHLPQQFQTENSKCKITMFRE